MTQHKNVYVALAAAQMEMEPAKKTADNPHFKNKYADLADLMDAVLPALNRNGLALFHTTESDDFGHRLRTVLYHGESGTSIESLTPLMFAKSDMQGYKASVTYAKRIGSENVTGVASEDDDGNASAASSKKNPIGEGIGDAWKDGVLDRLPENATPLEKAKAFADQICEDFAGYKSVKGLDQNWNKRKGLIDSLSARFPDLYSQVIDAFENRKMELDGTFASAAE